MQIVTLLALCCKCVQLSVYARFRAEIGGWGVGELEARETGFVKKRKFCDLLACCFFS